jgi:hypothetical protein
MPSRMPQSLEDILIAVWRQTLLENKNVVNLEGQTYPVKTTKGFGLKQVDFVVADEPIRGLEQNPATKSRWATLARDGKKVMQFLQSGRYIAAVVDGKLHAYGRVSKNEDLSE